jgi:ABC-type transport system involved in multi-copper enzyme maturation permease subunit
MLQKKRATWGWSRLGAVVLLLGAATTNVLLWATDAGPAWLTWAVWGLIGVGVLLLPGPLWRQVFGPVLFYDLVRSTRRGRYAVLRGVYAAALLIMLFLLYARWSNGLWEALWMSGIDRTKAAQLASDFFTYFMALQYLAVVLLTPAVSAGAIAEEKDRRTLEFLFTTDLYSHEIVFGKLFSRVAFLTLLLLTGLPVLSLLQFVGGVDPELVAAGFAGTLLTMLSLASLSLFNSAYARKPITAMFLTYLQVGAYLAVSTVLAQLVEPMAFKRTPSDWAILFFGGGNILIGIQQLREAASMPGGVSAALPGVVAGYALFHGLVTLLALLGATLPLRRWTRLQASRGARRSFVLALTQRRLPRVSDHPMIWKEVYAEPTFRFNRTGMVVTATFISVCLVIATFIEACLLTFGLSFGDLDRYMNTGARFLGTAVACLLLLGVAVRAAGSFSGERDRQTLVSLLSTPLEGRQILWAKWLGSVLCGRKVWWYLAIIWLAALVTGGLHPVALPLVLIAWTCYAAFLASLGLWFSLVSRNSMRATICTLLIVLATCVGPWLLSAFWTLIVDFAVAPTAATRPWMAPRPEPGLSDQVPQLLSALAPPSSLGFLTFCERDFLPEPAVQYGYGYGPPPVSPVARLLAIVFALLGYVLAAVVLYNQTCARFGEVTGRMPLGRGRRAPPARKSA